jgi:zinc protease
MLKQIDLDAKTNSYWMTVIDHWRTFKLDRHNDYKKTVEALTPESLSRFVREKILGSGNHVEVVMLPE